MSSTCNKYCLANFEVRKVDYFTHIVQTILYIQKGLQNYFQIGLITKDYDSFDKKL